MRRFGLLACLFGFALAGLAQGLAAGATPGVGWVISSAAWPTNFADGEGEQGDRYVIILTNAGAAPSSGPITVTDFLPEGVTVDGEVRGEGWGCSRGDGIDTLQCTTGASVAPLAQSETLQIPVAVAPGTRPPLSNRVVASGGGASPVASSTPTVLGSSPVPSGFLDFKLTQTNESGAIENQAGGHPWAIIANYDVPSEGRGSPVQQQKDIEVDLPAGLVGNPLAVPRCPIAEVFHGGCPRASQIGTFFDDFGIGNALVSKGNVYNVIPEPGYPVEFAAWAPNSPNIGITLYGNETGSDYHVHFFAPDIPGIAEANDVIFTLWGNPALVDGNSTAQTALFTNPVECAGSPLLTDVSVDFWGSIGEFHPTSSSWPPLTGCDLLRFSPSIAIAPSTTLADEPAGYTVDMRIPQSQGGFEDVGSPDLKDVRMKLPPGVSISPGVADGLVGCPAEGPEGFDLTAYGVVGHCPPASQLGVVQASTPVLAEPLTGRVYVSQPGCGGAGQAACTEADASNGTLFGLDLELTGSGVVVKLHGALAADPATGQLTVSFEEAPQLPVSDIKLAFKGGPRAPLANPRSCGEALTTSDLTPWSSPQTADAYPRSAFDVSGCEGSAFSPAFTAGTTSVAGGSYTDFSLTLGRSDRQQDLSQISVRTPPGLLGMLSSVPLCGEPQAQAGACPSASQIGTLDAAAGSGSHPFWASGQVYLTGPYKGAPFGVSIVVPAVAGPFNLGDVVIRATIDVDPKTAALTITSDPFPQIIDGIPLRLQTINVNVDRPGFMFNPTNCAQQEVTATVAGVQGASAQVSSPFAAGSCDKLPFKLNFSASSQARTSRLDGASLDVKLAMGPGQANIAKVKVALPRRLPSRLSTLQHACPQSVFAANPAGCPAASLVGFARASTPVLPTGLIGPAYFVSNGGSKFPELVVILQGDGVRVDLHGETLISKAGITSSTFASVPDVPVHSFELYLPEGPHSALAANGDLCKGSLAMPTTITAQNGAQIQQSTKVRLAGCARKPRVRGKGRGRGKGSVSTISNGKGGRR